jgi:hypothetical protein
MYGDHVESFRETCDTCPASPYGRDYGNEHGWLSPGCMSCRL